MDAVKRKMTAVGIVTAIVGLAVGLGIGVWGIKTSRASGAQMSKTPANSEKQDSTVTNRKDEWDPFREMERMQEEIDRAVRHATEQFQLGPMPVTLRSSICAIAKITSSCALICRMPRLPM